MFKNNATTVLLSCRSRQRERNWCIDAVYLFVCLLICLSVCLAKNAKKNAIFPKTKQFRAIDDT